MSEEQKINPLYQTEKDVEDLKKEIEEKIKGYSKLDLKSFNKDKDAYKQGLNEAISALQDYSARALDLLNRVNSLKKEDEDASLKEKEFKKRQSSEQKKAKDIQSKIEKCLKKVNQDLEKQKKADEKEEAKRAKQEAKHGKKSKDSEATGSSALREIITEAIDTEKQLGEENKEPENEEEEAEDNEKGESDKEEETKENRPKVAPSLKEMIAQARQTEEKQKSEDEDEENQSEEELDEEYESEKEEKEKKQKIAQNLINIYKNKMKKEDIEENKKSEEPPAEKIEETIEKDKSEHDEVETKEEKKVEVSDESEEEDKSEGDEIEPQPRIPATTKISQEPKNDSQFENGTKFVVVKDYEPEIEDDLKITKGEIVEFEDLTEDDGYYIVKNSEGNSGSVPAENLKLLSNELEEDLQEEVVQEEEMDEEKEKKDKKSKKKSKDLINTNALIVNESVPCTFADSFLVKVSNDSNHSYEKILRPKMSQSNLNFSNFFWDQKENKIRNRMNTILKAIVVHKCTNIPAPNKQELEVLSRSLRVCLFDGVSVIGNVHTIRAHIVGRDDRTWVFEDSYKALVSLFDFSEFFLIANAEPEKPNLGLLFELSIYAKKINTDEETELCCGWAHLPFVDEDKNFQLVNKSYDLVLNGGSVYDKSMPLDPSVPRNNGTFNEFITKMFKESKIKFNIREPTSQALETISVLPSPLICSSLTATFMRFYYEEFAVNFIVPLADFGSFDVSTEPVHSEFLNTFPIALNNADILNAIRVEFNHVKNNLKRDERNDGTKLRKWFLKTYNDFYPLLFHFTMPSLAFHNHEALEQRQIIIDILAKKIRKENKLEFLLDENQKFDPFNIEELRYEIMA